MLRFNLGPIPVEVRYSHLAMAAAIALTFLPRQLSAANPPLSIAYVAAVMAVISASVLFHEIGHALVSLAFGYRPAIELVWIGGLTRPNAPKPLPWHRDVLLTLAGPAFGILLGVLCYLVLSGLTPTGLVRNVLWIAVVINIGWSVINLLPILPLDGGRISAALLIRLFGRRGFLIAQIVGLAVAGGVVLTRMLRGGSPDTYYLFLFALLAMRSVAQIAAYFRGESLPGLEHPAERHLAQALTSYSQGELDAARRQADSLVQQVDLPSALRSRAHHLLGWIDIKEGQGRAALDQFSQVQGQAVEPQALAAAFALIGDEARSAALWEIAYRRTGDRTVLHEWAGTLIRAGRLDEAKKLPGVDLASAFMCAQRVFFIRGHYSEAAQVGVTALGLSPRAQIAYDTACALARAGDVSGALRTLEKAAELGFSNADFAASDADLASLHARPEFHSWLQRLRQTEAP